MKKKIQRCSSCKDRIGEPRYEVDGVWKREGHLLPDDWDKVQFGADITTCPECKKNGAK